MKLGTPTKAVALATIRIVAQLDGDAATRAEQNRATHHGILATALRAAGQVLTPDVNHVANLTCAGGQREERRDPPGLAHEPRRLGQPSQGVAGRLTRSSLASATRDIATLDLAGAGYNLKSTLQRQDQTVGKEEAKLGRDLQKTRPGDAGTLQALARIVRVVRLGRTRVVAEAAACRQRNPEERSLTLLAAFLAFLSSFALGARAPGALATRALAAQIDDVRFSHGPVLRQWLAICVFARM